MTFLMPVMGGDGIRRTFLGASLEDFASAPKTTFTFANVPFGAAFPERRIVAAFGLDWQNGLGVTGVTIGGVAATLVGVQENLTVGVCMAVAHVPNGASGNIVITSFGNAFAVYGAFYSLSGLDHTAQDSKLVAAGAGGNIDVPSSGACIGVTVRGLGAISWTGLTEDDERNEGAFLTYSAASGEFSSAAANHAVSTTGGTASSLIAASWGP